MIRLIATDMDGTLLDNSKQLDKEFYSLFQQLKELNIIFVIASGNQFYHLYNQFLPVSDDLYFISENGNYITKGKQELWCYSLDMKIVESVIHILNRYPELMTVICGKKKSYIFKDYYKYKDEIDRHFDVYEFINCLNDIDDEILKFSIHDPKGKVNQYVGMIDKELPEYLKIITSGHEWMDIQDRNIHKGTGIKFLAELFHLDIKECAAFGDQMNDYEMLDSVYYSYAMGNAVQEIKDIAYEIVLSNEKQGVLKKIKELLEGELC